MTRRKRDGVVSYVKRAATFVRWKNNRHLLDFTNSPYLPI